MSEGSSGRWFAAGSAGFLRSTALNVATQAVVYGSAILCVPLIIGRLGPETFGLLTLFWIVVGAVPFLDLGLSQATVRFVSSALTRDDRADADALVRRILRAAMLVGICLAVTAVGVTYAVPQMGLRLPEDVQAHVRPLGLMIASAIPALVLAGPLRGVAQSARRFDLVNALQGGTGFLQWTGTLVVVLLGGQLDELLTYTVLVRYVTAIASYAVVRRVLPGFRLFGSASPRNSDRAVLSFGGWIFVSQAVGPLLLLSERLIITGAVSLEAQAWYSAPVDALLRFLVLPVSVATALYPFLASKSDEPGMRGQMASLTIRSTRLVMILMVPVILTLLVYGDILLSLWLGTDTAEHLRSVWVYLVLGLLAHSLAQVPYVALQALDAPRDIAVLLLIEFPAYLPIFFLLTSTFGIAGAAIAWMARVSVELIVLVWRTRRQLAATFVLRPDRPTVALLIAGGLGLGFLSFLRFVIPSMAGSMAAVAVFGLAYAAFVWLVVLDSEEKAAVVATLRLPGDVRP